MSLYYNLEYTFTSLGKKSLFQAACLEGREGIWNQKDTLGHNILKFKLVEPSRLSSCRLCRRNLRPREVKLPSSMSHTRSTQFPFTALLNKRYPEKVAVFLCQKNVIQ